MIHSKEKTAAQVVAFARRYRAEMGSAALPLVAVPSSYSVVTARSDCPPLAVP